MSHCYKGRIRLRVWSDRKQQWRTCYVLITRLQNVLYLFKHYGIKTRTDHE